MPAIQQASPTGVFNFLTTQKTVTQKSLPIIAIKSSAITRLSSTMVSGLSTGAFLNGIGKTTQETTATGDGTVTMPNSTSNSTSKSESVTAKAGVATSNESFTLSDHINLLTEQTQSEKETKNRGVKHVTPCLNDYYIQNNNGSTSHKLINICENSTVVSGYVDPKCTLNNSLSVFTLNKQGDLYTVETQDTDNCEQAIQTENLPTKLGDCLYDFRTRYDKHTFEDRVINGCKNTVAEGYVDTLGRAHCQVSFDPTNPSAKFTLKPSEVVTIQTFRFCYKAVYEGKPAIKISACLRDSITPNDNGTATHRVTNVCFGGVTYGHVRKGCTVNPPSSNNEWNHFGLSKNAEISFLIQDKEDCEDPVRYGDPPITSYEKLYCPPANSSLTDLPKAEKIVAGDGLLSKDARHLVFMRNKGVNFCSGSLISDRYVLTAAHCVKKIRTSRQSLPLEKLRVYHDPYPRLKATQYIPATEYKVKVGHIFPCYVYTQEDNCDLALLELEKPIVNGQIVSLPTDQDFCEFAKEVDRALATDTAFPYELSGQYDKTQSVWQEGNVLAQGFGKERDAKGNIVNSERAKQAKLVAFKIAGRNGLISARPNNNGDNICSGDSGGALIHRARDGRKVQVGVTCCFTDGNSKQCTGGVSYTNLHNKAQRKWLEERMAEDSTSVKIKPRDLTRLRVSLDSCVEKIDEPDGFLSWLGGFTFSIQGRRRITFTNNCHNQNHPTKVNVKFYSDQNNKEKQESVAGIEKIENVAQLDLGETRVFHTDGTAVKTKLTWSDLER